MYRGVLLEPDGIRYGWVVEDECIFEESRSEFDEYVISPTFFNAHTHLGDAIAKDPPHKPLTDLVTPPDGFKFRILSSHSIEELRRAVLHEVRHAKDLGTSHFLDFREGGVEGLRVVSKIDGVLALGRPESLEEAEKMESTGFGMSSVRDHDFDFLEELRKIARKRKMIFAIHAGEMDCEDVELAISLEPDVIIHMNACEMMLKDVIDAEIPIVSCIRSNAFFGLLNLENYRVLCQYDCWMMGTDNAMLVNPSVLQEMHFASYLLRRDAEIFRAALRGFDLFGVRHGYVVFNREYNFRHSRNFLSTLVRRAESVDIERVILPE